MWFQASVYSGKCNFWQVFILGSVISGKCLFCRCNFSQVFILAVVILESIHSGSCDFWQMLIMKNKHSGKCFSGKWLSGKWFSTRCKDTLASSSGWKGVDTVQKNFDFCIRLTQPVILNYQATGIGYSTYLLTSATKKQNLSLLMNCAGLRFRSIPKFIGRADV